MEWLGHGTVDFISAPDKVWGSTMAAEASAFVMVMVQAPSVATSSFTGPGFTISLLTTNKYSPFASRRLITPRALLAASLAVMLINGPALVQLKMYAPKSHVARSSGDKRMEAALLLMH